jgi:hypothetical protein
MPAERGSIFGGEQPIRRALRGTHGALDSVVAAEDGRGHGAVLSSCHRAHRLPQFVCRGDQKTR